MRRFASLCPLLWLALAASQIAAQVSFAPEVRHGVQDGPWSVAVADFNLDGFDDIVAVNRWSDNISILLNQTDGSFGNPRHIRVGTLPNFVLPADLDGDGAVDLVVVNTKWDHLKPVRGSVSVLLGHGDGTFRNDRKFNVGFRPDEAGVGDFDMDGILDLIVANTADDTTSSFGSLSFLKGRGDGTFANELEMPAFAMDSGDISVCHIDDDGLPDLLVSRARANGLREYLGNGDGTFTYFNYVRVDHRVFAHTIADFDGDGNDDIAIADENASFFYGYVSIIRGWDNGVFTNMGHTGVGDHPIDVVVGDFDGDGLQDVVTANHDTNDISILLGRGDLTLEAEIRFAVGQSPRSVAAGDFTGDGRFSVVVANYQDDDISVLFNTGPVPPSEPVADAGPDQTIQATSDAGATVTLDGTGSRDPDNDIILYEWIEDLGGPGEVPLGQGEILQTLLSPTSHLITLRVTDSTGGEDVDDVLIVVTPPDPPDLTLTVSPDVLWPPNHRMVDVRVTLSPGPTCTTPTAVLASFGSTEADDVPGDGDGNTTGDIREADAGTEDHAVLLRAERFSPGPGRTYGLTYTISCESGIEISEILTVGVSDHQSGVAEPLMIDLIETPSGTRVDWTAVPAATNYDVIRGDLTNIGETVDAFELGVVACVEANSLDESTAGLEDSEIPPPGSTFFYLVEYWDDADSGYGTESASKPRTSTAGDCF